MEIVPNHNYTTLERRIYTQQQMLNAPRILRLLSKVQDKINDLVSPEKTSIIEGFAASHKLVDSFHEEYQVDLTTWRYNVALYQSHITGEYFLRVEYQFISNYSSIYKTFNYTRFDRIKYDNLYRAIHQLDWIENDAQRENTKACIITELNNFSPRITLAELMEQNK